MTHVRLVTETYRTPADRVRSTSLLAYRTIVENGLLSEMRMRAYRALAENGPMTALELDRYLGGERSDGGRRLSELRDAGVVREVRKRPCLVTGNLAIEWDTTNELPTKKLVAIVARPSSAMLREAAELIKTLWAERDAFSPMPPELELLTAWIDDGARCPKGH